jgi:GNAT superfamily N-acetyltransferase
VTAPSPIEVRPVTADRWDDLVELFGPKGVSGCWCMWWRMPAKDFPAKAYEGNRRAMRAIVRRGDVPGLLAYREGRPVGWVSIAPREEFTRIERSRVLGPVDDAKVWSVVCFFIHRTQRGSGVGTVLLEAAIELARKRGARIVEGYPVDPLGGRASNAGAFTGLEKMFRDAGFKEVERRSASRPIMRKTLAAKRSRSR